MTNPIQVLRDYAQPHTGGFPMDDRGDGLHWLTCVDCGQEWAEKDDGSHAAGQLECARPAYVAALQQVEALVAAATNVHQSAVNRSQVNDWRTGWISADWVEDLLSRPLAPFKENP
jgi:hypothetical protein